MSTSAKDTATAISSLFAETSRDGDFDTFFNTVYLPKMKGVKGWRRTARHSVVDSLVMSAGQLPKANTAEQWLIVNGMYTSSIHCSAEPKQTSRMGQRSHGKPGHKSFYRRAATFADHAMDRKAMEAAKSVGQHKSTATQQTKARVSSARNVRDW